jgi:hypothetical protein
MLHDQKRGDLVRIRDSLSSLRYTDNDLIRELRGKRGTVTKFTSDEVLWATFSRKWQNLEFHISELEYFNKVCTPAIIKNKGFTISPARMQNHWQTFCLYVRIMCTNF